MELRILFDNRRTKRCFYVVFICDEHGNDLRRLVIFTRTKWSSSRGPKPEAGEGHGRNWGGICVCVYAWSVCAGIAEVEMSASPPPSLWLRPSRDHNASANYGGPLCSSPGLVWLRAGRAQATAMMIPRVLALACAVGAAHAGSTAADTSGRPGPASLQRDIRSCWPWPHRVPLLADVVPRTSYCALTQVIVDLITPEL